MKNRTTQQGRTSTSDFDYALGRMPPYNADEELGVIGALLGMSKINQDDILSRLSSDDFYKPSHKEVFDACVRLSESRKVIDLMSVVRNLRDNEKLEDVGGVVGVSQMTNGYLFGSQLQNTIDWVVNASLKRKAITSLSRLVNELYDPKFDSHDIVKTLDVIGREMINRLVVSEEKKLNEVVVEVMDDIGSRAQGDVKDGVKTQIRAVDRIMYQFSNSDLIIIGARPAMGKTSWVVSAAMNMARAGVSVGIFSLEMSSKQLGARIMSQELEMPTDEIMKRALDETRLMHIHKNIHKLDGWPMYFDDEAGLSIEDFRMKATRMVKQHSVRCIFVDYLQLMCSKSSNNRGGNREQEISQISRGLKIVAKELNIPIVVLSQLSRSVESRQDKRPLLSDLRESGSIEQDADVVAFLYRPEYYGILVDSNGNSLEGVGEFIVAKNRNGELGTAKMRFVPQYTRYCDFEESYASTSIMRPNVDFTQGSNDQDAPF
jgi:replicative DNA helicase